MKGRIYLLNNEEQLTPLEEVAYDSERLLQELLADYPDLLAGDQMDSTEPLRWLLVTREMSVAGDSDGPRRWSLDHLFLDQRGVPTLVEVKRSQDSRIRREVVGQMLDYAANAVAYWSADEIKAAFVARCRATSLDPGEELAQLLDEAEESEDYWHKVKTNLQAGRIRIVFASEDIPGELRRIVEFLNEQMNPAEVLAVEVKRFAGDGVATLVPRVLGQTEKTLRTKASRGSGRSPISETEFLARIAESRPASEQAVFRQVIAWARQVGLQDDFSQGPRGFKFAPALEFDSRPIRPIYVNDKGFVRLQRDLKKYPPFDEAEKRDELLQRLEHLSGFEQSEHGMEGSPKISTSSLTDAEDMSRLLEALSWLVAELRASRAA